MQRFFVDPKSIQNKSVQILDIDLIHQITKVLRMRSGDKCVLLDNSGREFDCTISEITQNAIIGKITNERECTNEAKKRVILFQALPKKAETIEMILQKCTELRVSAFLPIVSEHTERKDLPKPERLVRIIREAAEQSERGKIPELHSPISLKEGLAMPSELNLFLHSRGEFPPLPHVITQSPTAKNIHIFVGPEGGFSEAEVELARSHGAIICSLGKTILRTETAAIVAAAFCTFESQN